MSKVISFSISDRYLDKIRSLYPSLTDNLAAKQFLTDRLDDNLDDKLDDGIKTLIESSLSSSLDDALDAKLDDKLKTLIESSLDGILDERLDDAVKKSVSDLSERLSRLEERLDDNLDDGVDDNMEQLLRLQREASIASPIPPTGEPSPFFPSHDETIDQNAIESLDGDNSPINDAGEGAIEDDREWLTLQQIAGKKIKGLPGTQQGLRLHAKNWESRKNPQKRGEQYKIPKEYLK